MYNILVVDDREVFRRKLKRMPYWEECNGKFRISGEASNGLEALEFLRKQKIDLVLTDIRMPMVDGISLLKQIKQENLCSCVILLSEYAEFSYAREGILNGAFDYIVKPIDNAKVEDSFERAYTFLSSISETAPSSVHYIDALAEYILSGNLDDTMVYARHVDAEMEKDTPSREARAICMNDLLKKLEESLLSIKPYLKKYFMMKDLFHIDLQEGMKQRRLPLQNGFRGYLKNWSPLFPKPTTEWSGRCVSWHLNSQRKSIVLLVWPTPILSTRNIWEACLNRK